MRLATMLGDVLHSLFSRPVTEKYPFERRAAPDRLRGKLHWNPEKCTGCALCDKDCVSNAIEFITLDKATKQFAIRYYVDRCTFCGQCAQSCRFKCIEMVHDQWELAALSKEPFTNYYGTETNVAAARRLAKVTPSST
jgi:formate hydrogenlyase subunit 6/NADH:ubiquinone oxidoreductase subunit I